MVLFFSLLSLSISISLIFYALKDLICGKFNALSAGSLGLGGLVFIDIFKYNFLDAYRVGRVSDELFLLTCFVIYTSTFLIFSGYFAGRFILSSKSKSTSMDLLPNKNRLRRLKIVLIPVAFILAFIADRSGYASLGIGIVRGFGVALACYGFIYRDRKSIIVALLAIGITTMGVDESSRRSYIAIFFPIGLAAIAGYRKTHKLIGMKGRLKFLLVLTFLFIFLNAMRSSHDFGDGFDPKNPIGNTVHYITNLSSIDTFFNTAFIIENFPDRWDYFYGETYFSLLVAPIPRSLWVDKPVSLGAPLGLMQKFGIRDFDMNAWHDSNMFSLSPSFVGEAYANGGVVAVILISILLGFCMTIFDKKLLCGGFSMENIKWQVFLSSFLLVHRGDFYVALNFQIAIFISLFLFSKIFFVKKIAFGNYR